MERVEISPAREVHDRVDNRPITVRTGPSFVRLLYTFALPPRDGDQCDDRSGDSVLASLRTAAATQQWEDRRLILDYVLPHLADHMNAQDEATRDSEVGHWWRYAGELPNQWVLHAGQDRRVKLRLRDVEFIFFRTGIGILILEIDLDSDRLEDWQDVLHMTRFYRLPAADEPGSETTRGSVFARRARRLVVDDTVDGALAARLRTSGRFGFGLLIAELLSGLFGDHTWRRASVPGLLTPYSAFLVEWNGTPGVDRFSALYRWRRQLQSGASVAATHHEDLHAELARYAEDMWFAYSSEGGGFFGGDTPRTHFFDHELPDHLRRPYAFGYLLALHQRLALSRFSERIAHVVAAARGEGTSAEPLRGHVARLQDDFLEYLTRCHFAQVLRTTNHHANYRTWAETLEVPAFAKEVELQLGHLYERSMIADQIVEARRQSAVNGRVNAAVSGITLPAMVLAILQLTYPGGLSLRLAVLVTATAALVGTALGWLTAYIPVAGSPPRPVARSGSRRGRPGRRTGDGR